MARPGAVGLMRHALAPGTGDPANFDLDDCATQRNLSEAGRAQARAIGAAIRGADIAIDHVWTSRWCRSRETARLLRLGDVTEVPALDSFFADRSREPDQSRAVRRALSALPADARAILVSHQVNITALTGIYPRSGEVVVIAISEDGVVTPVGRFLVAD